MSVEKRHFFMLHVDVNITDLNVEIHCSLSKTALKIYHISKYDTPFEARTTVNGPKNQLRSVGFRLKLAATKNKALNGALTWESTMDRKPAVQGPEVCGTDLDYRPT